MTASFTLSIEIAREYFTNAKFRRWLEDYTWEMLNH